MRWRQLPAANAVGFFNIYTGNMPSRHHTVRAKRVKFEGMLTIIEHLRITMVVNGKRVNASSEFFVLDRWVAMLGKEHDRQGLDGEA
jgi:hypothetical protein